MNLRQIEMLDTVSADYPHHSSIWEAPYEVVGEIYDAITDEVGVAGANVLGQVIAEICQL